MKKTKSHPPLVILFDPLFMMLFVSALKQENVLEITLPNKHIPSDFALLDIGNPNITTSEASRLGIHGISYLVQCSGQIECKDKPDTMRIAMPDGIQNEIAKLVTGPFADGYCKRLTIPITVTATGAGIIDYRVILDGNSCLNKISGIKEWIAYKVNSQR